MVANIVNYMNWYTCSLLELVTKLEGKFKIQIHFFFISWNIHSIFSGFKRKRERIYVVSACGHYRRRRRFCWCFAIFFGQRHATLSGSLLLFSFSSTQRLKRTCFLLVNTLYHYYFPSDFLGASIYELKT